MGPYNLHYLIVFRDRGIVMSLSPLFSQRITNLVWNRYRSAVNRGGAFDWRWERAGLESFIIDKAKAPCKRTQHCWPTTPNIVECYMLRPFAHPVAVVACCCAKLETGETFQPTTPNISFVPWSLKRSAAMLDPFAQLFRHCWGHARSLRVVYKDLWDVSFPRCSVGPHIVGSCYIRLQTTANTHATTPNIVCATTLGVVASVCTQPNISFLEIRRFGTYLDGCITLQTRKAQVSGHVWKKLKR